MKTIKKEFQKAIYEIKNGKGELIDRFARWQAEYTGNTYYTIKSDLQSMLSMAREVYGEFLSCTDKDIKQEYEDLAKDTDTVFSRLSMSDKDANYIIVSLIGILARLQLVQVREKDETGKYNYINGFTSYLETLM